MLNKFNSRVAFSAAILFSAPALAHIEYFDLNQGAHVSELTAAGKTASTTQYGTTPADVMALNGPPRADGISTAGLSSQQDLPLNNTSLWNATNQVLIGGGSFSGVTYTPGSSSATVDVNDVTDFAWADGTKATLGDSHKVDFFNFRLAQPSNVTITWNVDTAGTYLDCGFSLYRGVLPYQGHDDSVEILNPFKVGTGKVQDALDNGSYHDVQGILSVLRNTAPGAPTYIGQFNALNNWGQANPAGNWATVAFLNAVNARITQLSANPSDTLETLSVYLPAGNYTIAASGALGAPGSGASFGLTNLHGRLTYSAAAVADADGDGVADSADNCPATANPGQQDGDGDGRGNACDNCTTVANADQYDADQDGYGNRCDGDLSNNNTTNAQDYAMFRTKLGSADAAADLNHNGTVNAQDYAMFRPMLGSAPGPSGLACAGTIPCPSP